MHKLIVVLVAAALVGCGVETATTAVTAAALKKQEVEQGRKTMERVQQSVSQAMEQVQQNTQTASDAAGK